ncbi:MAG: MbtH family protein [Anaerolineales bacterium]|nr:MbtH family protein [Anaerolineales bacterium]
MFDEFEDRGSYKVVINHEEQYSLWPKELATPSGWKEVGTAGDKRECIAYIERAWAEMRPLKLHSEMAEKARHLLRGG